MLPILAGAGTLVAGVGALVTKEAVMIGLKVTIIVLMKIINVALIVSQVGIVAGYLLLYQLLYNKMHDLLVYIEELSNSSTDGVNGAVPWALKVVESMGIWDAFIDVFTVFAPILLSLLLLIGSKKLFKLLKEIRESLFKIAMVITQ